MHAGYFHMTCLARLLCYIIAAFKQVITLIETLAASAAQDSSKQETDAQQALALLTAQQPINIELLAKLAKAALQAGASTAAIQAANALLATALPQVRAAQDIVEASDAPGVAVGDWQWLAVASCVLGQVTLPTYRCSMPGTTSRSKLHEIRLSSSQADKDMHSAQTFLCLHLGSKAADTQPEHMRR